MKRKSKNNIVRRVRAQDRATRRHSAKKRRRRKETRTAKKLSGKAHIQEHNDEKMTRKA